MKELANILKVFVEKHLIPTVLAVGCAILTLIFVPSDFWMITKIGITWFGVFLFCAFFVVSQIVIKIFKAIAHVIHKSRIRSSEQERITKENRVALQQLWTLVDGMTPEDYDYLMQFIKSNNAPIEITGNTMYLGDRLFNSKFVNVTTKAIKEERPSLSNNPLAKSGHLVMPIEGVVFSTVTKQYKLKDDFYQILKYSYDKHGRISNFDKE